MRINESVISKCGKECETNISYQIFQTTLQAVASLIYTLNVCVLLVYYSK